MTDQELLARIDERTQAIQRDVIEIKKNQSELRSDVDTLKAEHRERLRGGQGCNPVNIYPRQGLSGKELALTGLTASAPPSVVALVIMGKVLGWW